MLFDGLMRFDLNGELKHAIAYDVQISQDEKTYDFFLRPATWSDGEEITAYDFEHAWKRSITPKTLAHGAQNFYFIKNAEAIIKGELPIETAGITAIDAKHLKVELQYPAPYFLEYTACSVFYPVPKHLDLSLIHI